MAIIKDISNSPLLFQLEKVERDSFSSELPLAPEDLIEFWTKLGAGEIFESETIYSPAADEGDDTVLAINEYFAAKGMSPTYTVFHTGVAITAYRTEDPKYVILDEETFEVVSSFSSLEEWYDNVLRTEYAERYGMK